MAVQMELTRIIINETSDSHIIFLKEVDGERMFPIVIGIFEASSIDRRVRNQATPRPLTHDLLANAIDLLGGTCRISISTSCESTPISPSSGSGTKGNSSRSIRARATRSRWQ